MNDELPLNHAIQVGTLPKRIKMGILNKQNSAWKPSMFDKSKSNLDSPKLFMSISFSSFHDFELVTIFTTTIHHKSFSIEHCNEKNAKYKLRRVKINLPISPTVRNFDFRLLLSVNRTMGNHLQPLAVVGKINDVGFRVGAHIAVDHHHNAVDVSPFHVFSLANTVTWFFHRPSSFFYFDLINNLDICTITPYNKKEVVFFQLLYLFFIKSIITRIIVILFHLSFNFENIL